MALGGAQGLKCKLGRGRSGTGPGTPVCAGGSPKAGFLTMATPTALKTSTLARSSATSEKRVLSCPMTRPWMT